MKVYLSPSSQTANLYTGVDTNEASVCGEIASHLAKALERCGIETMTGHMISMGTKCMQSDEFGANLHIPIHTNASPKHNVTGTRIFCYNETGEGHKAATSIFNFLAPVTIGTSETISTRTDLYEIWAPKAPTVYIEVDFHDVEKVAKWLVANTKLIAETICRGICFYFNTKYVEETGTEKETYLVIKTDNPDFHYNELKSNGYNVMIVTVN